MDQKLLSRDAFREAVFARDRHTCVFCSAGAKDAHHILERRLFADGGYYLNNGASVCETHHMACEMTTLDVETVRARCGITKPVIPDHLYADQPYDKWGNPVLANGQRTRGELFFDESVQKILGLGGVLDLFTHYVKYPRTYHVPTSPGITEDDRQMKDWSGFEGERVIITDKMDGENNTLYTDYFHARSVDGRAHPAQDYAKNLWGQVCGDIPPMWRVCVENLYERHSIAYEDLPALIQGFSVWDDRNRCLDWDATSDWLELLGVRRVPVLYDGPFERAPLAELSARPWDRYEGWVIRAAEGFGYGEFRNHVGKWVRKGHVQTTKHGRRGPVVRNGLGGAA